VRGTIRYEGERARDFARPVLVVTADTALNSGEDAPTPHALATYRDIDLDSPMEYELSYLLPGRYYLIALVGDLDNFDPATSPIGSFPNACTLAQMAEERSVQVEEDDLDGIDITIYDTLSTDPCFGSTPGADAGDDDDAGADLFGVLETRVTAPTLSPSAGDTLRISLFTESPLANPTPAFIETVDGPSFPATVSLEVPADDYTVIVCFQAEGSPSSQCLGPDDRLAFYPSLSETVRVDAGASTVVEVELAP
jgi:hypothetical protein